MTLFSNARRFRTWLYTPSHNSLIFRGEKAADDGQNIDLKFGGVFYAEIVPEYDGLLIRRSTPQRISELRGRLGFSDSKYDGPDSSDPNASGGYYLLESQGVGYLVVASFFYIEYNRYSYEKVTVGEGVEVRG
jgi:hypothetical protein